MTTDFTTDPTPTKHCSKCDRDLPATAEYFYRQAAKKDGFNPICKVCINAQQAEYKAANPDKVKANKKAEYERNKDKYIKRAKEWGKVNRDKVNATERKKRALDPDKANERKRRWRAENPEENKERSRKWKAENKDKVKSSRARYWAANKERLNAKQKEQREGDPQTIRAQKRAWYRANKEVELDRRKINREKRLDRYRKIKVVSESARRARKAALPDTFRTEDWEKCLVYFNHQCAACGRPADSLLKLSVDHFIPFSAADCPGNVPTNVIPLCCGDTGCNNSKSKRDALEWATDVMGKRKAQEFMSKVQAYFDSLKA